MTIVYAKFCGENQMHCGLYESRWLLSITVSLLRPVIGSNAEIDVVALNWFAHVRKQFAAAFKWLYKYFTSSSTVFIENSTFTVIIKLLHHWETPVQMSSRRIMLLFLLFCSFSILFHPLFSLEAAVSVFASTSSTSMSVNNSLKTVPKTSQFGISSPNGSSDSIPV